MLHCIVYSLMNNISSKLNNIWYSKNRPPLLLIILSKIFSLIIQIRSILFTSKILRSTKVSVPVIVVGNITVGGTGKTPITLFLADWFHDKGKKVGIISRGYKGEKTREQPFILSENDNAKDYGDEAVYMARESKAMVCVCKNKTKAAELLIDSGAELIISDDGLQHYKLARDHEIVVIDSTRLLGNGYYLPAGPLRESSDRLNSVDLILINGGKDEEQNLFLGNAPTLNFNVQNEYLVDLNTGQKSKLKDFRGQTFKVLAGLGNPEKVYKKIEDYGIEVIPIITEDHGLINLENFNKENSYPLMMTPKDAVKYNGSFPNDTYLLEPTIEIDKNYFLTIFGQYL